MLYLQRASECWWTILVSAVNTDHLNRSYYLNYTNLKHFLWDFPHVGKNIAEHRTYNCFFRAGKTLQKECTVSLQILMIDTI